MPSKYRKNYVYSSERAMRICEGLLKDRSEAEKISESVLIEDSILNTLLPQHREAAMWVELMYDDETLADAYAHAFAGLAAGTNYQAAHDNGQALIREYYLSLSFSRAYHFRGDETACPHLVQQLTYLLEIFPAHDALHDRHLLEHYIEQLRTAPAKITAQEIVSYIHLYIDILGNSTYTYRALMDIASMTAPVLRDSPALRIAYIDTLSKISREW